ncbi:2-hydroxyacyl-CoA dehydratase subunit D [Spirochaetota bacterium]
MEELKIFNEIAHDPYGYVEDYKIKTKNSIMGYFCSYTPEEIIHASGCLPVRIINTGRKIEHADRHLQSYSCALIRGSLDDALSERLSFLDGTVFPHTCDSIQRLSDIWRLNTGIPMHFDIILPIKLNTESSKKYFVEVYEKFRRDLEEKLKIKITDDMIKKSIQLYNNLRKTLSEIYDIKSRHTGIISDIDMHSISMSSMVMDRNELLHNLNLLKSVLNKEKVNHSENSAILKRVMLSGSLCHEPAIYSVLNESGLTVAWNDLCTGERSFSGNIDLTGKPVNSIAVRYIDRIICPAKHKSPSARGEQIIKHAKDYNIRGVIFLIMKFCDPHMFDYPYLRQCLDAENVPSILIEMESQLSHEGQLRTKLETFAEMIN